MADAKISALTALTGANTDIAVDVLVVVDTSVTQSKKMTVNELGIALSLYKSGQTTHDVSSTGTQAITGVGFKPKAVTFMCAVNSTAAWSYGIDDGTTASCVGGDSVDVGADGVITKTTSSIILATAPSSFATANITSLDSDGFTITWAKIGTPTGTASVFYLAHR